MSKNNCLPDIWLVKDTGHDGRIQKIIEFIYETTGRVYIKEKGMMIGMYKDIPFYVSPHLDYYHIGINGSIGQPNMDVVEIITIDQFIEMTKPQEEKSGFAQFLQKIETKNINRNGKYNGLLLCSTHRR